jgi:hypothetical protein
MLQGIVTVPNAHHGIFVCINHITWLLRAFQNIVYRKTCTMQIIRLFIALPIIMESVDVVPTSDILFY